MRQLRLRCGWTQRDLAARIGLHPNTVARLERNEHPIRESVARLVRFVATSRPSRRKAAPHEA